MLVKADLHIHTCLSPCASLEMSPAAIAGRLESLGFSMAAVADHNSALNSPAFEKACRRAGIVPLFGIEVNSVEEAHLLCLFETSGAALDFGSYIYERLPDMENIPERLGDQVYVDEKENILGEVKKYLGNAVSASMDEVMEEVFSRGGLFIPAHVDKPVFSVTSQLGFLPDGNYSAVEVFDPFNAEAFSDKWCVITSSDAHYPDDVGKNFIEIELEENSFGSLRKAFESFSKTKILLR